MKTPTNNAIASDERILEEFDKMFHGKGLASYFSTPNNTVLWTKDTTLLIEKNIKDFIHSALLSAREDERKSMKQNIGMLRQWLNEKSNDRMVTDFDIETFLFSDDKK